MITKDSVATFTWDFGSKFFLESKDGNAVWSDPDYGGDNTIRPYAGSYAQWIGKGLGRDKGMHRVGDYCGEGVVILAK